MVKPKPQWTYDKVRRYQVFPPGRHGEEPNWYNPNTYKAPRFDTLKEAEEWVRLQGGELVHRGKP